ncbi:PfkB family carbohydrate kinase [Pseudonocardia sp. H11422]|uniref:PfkB family carbohydrate kinase n=1 Tax=Pseudonocardia sp. H11422 TaxID=2835866 RepID=UPI0027E3177D|nr:PfkB family carbohydrate kinase [Pseudonocardia sp. H11422]
MSGPANGTVVVVGAINVDFVVATDRLPGPGETVVGADLVRHGGGKGANAAVAAARAGATVRLVGAVGADDTGTAALDELRSEGVLIDDVAVLDDAATGVALIVVDAEGENQIAVGAGANMAVDPGRVRAALRAALPEAGCVLVSTEIPPEAVAAAVEAATAAGVRCVLNPAPAIPVVADLLGLGPLLTPNTTELGDLAQAFEAGHAAAEILARAGGPPPDAGAPGPVSDREPPPGGTDSSAASPAVPARVIERARGLAARTGAPVVVTLGGDGVLAVTADGQADHVPPGKTTVRDTTGAGDTFNGVLAARLAAGDDLTGAVRIATVAASLSVSRVGARAGMPTVAAIDAALQG